MTIFIKNLLEKKHVTTLTPFWKLKLSEQEFNELKDVIVNAFRSYRSFDCCKIEAALYFAEWWKRLKDVRDKKGRDSCKDVYDSLGLIADYSDEFYKAAQKGLELAKGELIHINNNERLSSLFFQGGIPMNRVASESVISSGWDRFIRGLILRDYDFSALQQNQSARHSQSLIEFCDQLKEADEFDDKGLMPFYCDDAQGEKWYRFITEEIKKEKERIQKEHPFRIRWEFELDLIASKLDIYYNITGPQTLPKGFLESLNCSKLTDHDLSIYQDSKKVFGETYLNNFLYTRFFYRAPYTNGSYISVHVNENAKSVESDYLDMNIPQIIHKDEKGIYRLGNRIGASEILAVFSNNWEPTEAYPFERKNLTFEGEEYTLLHIPRKYDAAISFKNKSDGETFILPLNSPLYRTGITYQEDRFSNIFQEQLYTPQRSIVQKITEAENRTVSTNLQFRDKYSSEWKDHPSIGRIFIKPNQYESIAPIKAYFLGEKFDCKIKPGTDSFKIQFTWPYGRVKLHNIGRKTNDDWWEITKEECEGRSIIPCVFTPGNDSSKSFTLNLKTQFNDFCIYDINCCAIANDDTLPLSELNLYSYHLNYSTENKELATIVFKGTGKSYRLVQNDNELSVIEDLGEEWKVPKSGSLDKLLGGIGRINDIVGIKPYQEISINGPVNLSFKVGPSPFCPEIDVENNSIYLIERSSNNRRTYLGDLFAFALDDDAFEFKDVIKLKPSEPGRYPLLDEMPEKYLVCENNYTSISDRVQVRMLTNRNIAKSERKELSTAKKRTILKELRKNPEGRHLFGSERWKRILHWFELSYKYNIPSDKLHDLGICASDDRFLVFLAFHAFFLRNCNDLDLIDKLLSLEKGLSFKWWFINNDLFKLEQGKFAEGFPPDLLYTWALRDAADAHDIAKVAELCSITEDEFFPMHYVQYITFADKRFKEFMTRLALTSLCKGSEVDLEMAASLIKHASELIVEKCKDNKSYFNAILNCIATIELKKKEENHRKRLTNIEIAVATSDYKIKNDADGKLYSDGKFIKLSWDVTKDTKAEYIPISSILDVQLPEEPEEPILNYNMALVDSRTPNIENIIFPMENNLFNYTGENAKLMARRVEAIYRYKTRKDNNVFYRGSIDDIGNDNIDHSISNCETCRNSIIRYFERERLLFLQHLQYLINK